MGGSAAGAVEVYHTLRFYQGGEPLLTPDLSVGGEVTDAGSHWLVAVESIVAGGGGRYDPLADRLGGDEDVILPAVEGQNLIVDAFTELGGCLSVQDCCLALGGNLLNAQGAVGSGVVAHGSGLFELREL